MATKELARLDLRIPRKQKDYFEQALEIGGFRSLTDFLVASAQEAAMKAVRKHGAMRLSERERQAFVSALHNPPSPARALENAGKRYRIPFADHPNRLFLPMGTIEQLFR